MFNAENVVVAGGTFNINPQQNQAQTTTEYILQIFGNNYVPSATHDNDDALHPPKCHPGTRTSFLTHLSNWVEDTKSPVYLTWLNGPAGAGKSAIARSLAESLHCKSLLAASFFFFRTDSRRNSKKPLVMTLSYQISRSVPDSRTHIANIIKDDPTVTTMSLKTQFERLIIKPLVQTTADESKSLRPMLVIIDGLDECVEQDERILILKLIFDAHPYLLGIIKFLVVSRAEYDIQRSFDSVDTTLEQLIDKIELQENLQAYEDVRKYLRDNFLRIGQTHPLKKHFPPNWPPDDEVERLVEKSSGHFIYASTVIKYIENDTDRPQERLKTIVHLRSTSHKPYAALDVLYLNILQSSRAGHALLVKTLSIAILQFNNFWEPDTVKSVHFLESVLFLQPGEVELALLDLKSLVDVKDTIEFWHKSFSDFLLDSSRSSDEFYASPASAYTVIATGCLRLLSDETGLLERSWSKFTHKYPTRSLKCHHLLSLCCVRADTDLDSDLQAAMMEYEFNVIPAHIILPPLSPHFRIFCFCRRNYQRASIFKGTKVAEHLNHQFDRYLISELRHSIPLDSKVMDELRATVSPHHIDRKTYGDLTGKNGSQMVNVKSFFLRYLYHHDTDNILCEFLYSKDRAYEYFLGKCKPSPSFLKGKS